MPANKKPKQTISLMPVGGLEQPIALPQAEEIVQRVDERFDLAVKEHDLRLVLSMVRDLDQAGRLAGLGLARTFYRLYHEWEKVYAGEGEFEDELYTQLGKDPLTVSRYIGAWSVIEAVESKEVRAALMGRPVQDLIAMWQHENAHGDLDQEQLVELSEEPDTTSVRRKLRKIRGENPDGKSMNFVLKRDGTLELWRGDNVTAMGFLRRDAIDLRDPLRRSGLSTLIRRIGCRVDGILPPLRKPREKKKAKKK